MSTQQTSSSKTDAPTIVPNHQATEATHAPQYSGQNEPTAPLYWSVLHHKNVSEGGPTNIPEVIHERQPFISGGGADSALSGYDSTAGSPRAAPPILSQKQQSSGSDTKSSKKWGRIKEAVDSKELFIKYMPDENWETGASSANRKWSDMIHITHELTLKECLFLFLALLAIGVVAYSYVFEQWPILDSLYFTVVLLTTVGYGDITPQTPSGKLFASAFALGGIVLLGIVLGVVGSHLVEAEIEATEQVKTKTSSALEKAFTRRSRRKGLTIENLEALNGRRPLPRRDSTSSLYSVGSETTCSVYGESRTLSVSSNLGRNAVDEEELNRPCQGFYVIQRHLPGFLPLIIGGLVMGLIEHWWWDDAIYYCVVTATTIGFGDFHPETTEAKLCALLFVPIVVAATGYILGNLASYIVEQRRAKYNQRLWRSELKIEDLDALDEARDGGVSELEYIKFMLVAMRKIDASLFDELREQFVKLDITGDGKITQSDLKIMATRRLKKVSHKLRLREYKRELTKRGSSRSGWTDVLLSQRSNDRSRKNGH